MRFERVKNEIKKFNGTVFHDKNTRILYKQVARQRDLIFFSFLFTHKK